MNEPVMLSRRLAERTKAMVDQDAGVVACDGIPASPTPKVCWLSTDWASDTTYQKAAWKATGVFHSTALNASNTDEEISVDLYSESKISGQNSFVLAVFNGLWWAVAPVNAIQCGVTTSELTAGGTCSVTVGSGETATALTGVQCFLLNSGDTIPNGSKVVCVWRMSPSEGVFGWEIISMRCAQ